MKTKELNPNQDLELTYQPDFQAQPFKVVGPYDAVMPIANDLEALQTTEQAQTHKLASRIVKAAQTALESPTELTGRRATLAAKFYDLRFGTRLYDALIEKRNTERDLAMATRLGLLSIEDVSCQKHRKAIAKLHGMVE